MDNDLFCNRKKCRKRLTGFAWVTSCSHIFCDEDGAKQFNHANTCPACESILSGKFDIIRIDTQPSEQYKSMVLAGQKPETVLEVASRAVSFWAYQSHQEMMYQEHLASKSKEKSQLLEQYYEQILNMTKTELTSLKSQLNATKKEYDNMKSQYVDVSEKMMEKSRQYQQLQNMYDALRRKCVTPSSFEGGDGNRTEAANRASLNFDWTFCPRQDMLKRPATANQEHRIFSTPDHDFVLQPLNTPLQGDYSSQGAAISRTSRFIHEIRSTPNAKSQRKPHP